ncbi:site-specific integrase [Pseudanabaena sp. ABRG5-3]|uniref:site-specific integrase n=1 Tax=Pseudanabaena sp. ABRG5-3 TaxID=685565 RepID=UPI000DC6F180|nr:site-specific integrase [Pseudanabaena sp. ABRG5-3]BBC24767.1 site-specific recombinase, phage integrase family protein [Pseudanabaena sp. ABRG5-3]
MDRLAQANSRLKEDRSRCSIEQRGDRLLLRATLPPKPSASRQDWHRQRIFLKVNATAAGIAFAESEARKISALLDQGLFDWTPYLAIDKEGELTFDQWLEKFRQHKLAQGISETTWKKDYADSIKILEDFEIEKAIAAIYKITPNTRKRHRTCFAISAFFKFAGMQIDLKPYKGNYSPATVEPRDIPTDAVIQDWYFKIKATLWASSFGILATYGIRPEELTLLDFAEMPVLIVHGDKSNNSDRRVYPIYPEWVDLFDLNNCVMPRTQNTGKQCCHQFSRYKIPFTPYDLRHAWAIRSMEFGLPLELAAEQMGHTMLIHSQTYHKWISDRHHKQVFDRIMAKPDRITPPIATSRLVLINGGA